MEKKLTEEHYKRAAENGISKSTLRARVYQSRWDVEKAITTPVLSKRECSKLSPMRTMKISYK